MHINTCTHVHVHDDTYINAHPYMNILHACAHVHKHLHTNTCTSTHVHVHKIHAHTYMCIIHACTYTHTHICTVTWHKYLRQVCIPDMDRNRIVYNCSHFKALNGFLITSRKFSHSQKIHFRHRHRNSEINIGNEDAICINRIFRRQGCTIISLARVFVGWIAGCSSVSSVWMLRYFERSDVVQHRSATSAMSTESPQE